jgi:flagellar protein FlaG
MSFEIGPVPPVQPGGVGRRVAAATPPFSLDLARTAAPQDAAVLSLPASPPTEVLDAIGDAAERAAELRADNRELHFHEDQETRRVIVEIRDLEGNVIRTIPPSHALNVMAGAAL